MNIKKILVLLLFIVAITGIIAPINGANIVKIESKEKSIGNKVTWNGNGGKIASKKTASTTVKKGAKVGKLPLAKRSGYDFKGWYTKKTGGTKVSKNTKPKNSVTYYAQWTKGSTSTNSKLVGTWNRNYYYKPGQMDTYYWLIKKDGTFNYYLITTAEYYYKGKYSVSNGRIYFTNVVFTNAGLTPVHVSNEPESWVSYDIVHDDWGDQLRISNNEGSFTGASWWRRG